MKKISSRKFIICGYYNKEVPKQDGGCCDFYDHDSEKCGYTDYRPSRISKRQVNRLSEREDNYRNFNQQQSEED